MVSSTDILYNYIYLLNFGRGNDMENQFTRKTKTPDQGQGELLRGQNTAGGQTEAALENRHGNEDRLKIFIPSAEGKIRYFI
jgi:hypothetical protein